MLLLNNTNRHFLNKNCSELIIEFIFKKMGTKELETFIRENPDEDIAQEINIYNEIAKWKK